MKKYSSWEIMVDVVLILFGTAAYALGLYYFITPSNVAPGGVSGISILVNFVSGLPVGVVNAAINVPLLLVGWRFLGKEFIWKTLLSVISFTLFYDSVFPLFIRPYQGEKLLACLFGGVLMGIGLGLVFLTGISALSVQQSDTPAEIFDNPVGNILIAERKDIDKLPSVAAVDHHVNELRGNEDDNDGVKGGFDGTEDKNRKSDNHKV